MRHTHTHTNCIEPISIEFNVLLCSSNITYCMCVLCSSIGFYKRAQIACTRCTSVTLIRLHVRPKRLHRMLQQRAREMIKTLFGRRATATSRIRHVWLERRQFNGGRRASSVCVSETMAGGDHSSPSFERALNVEHTNNNNNTHYISE